MLQLKQLHASPGPEALLRGIDLEVDPGEIHGIIGPNGAGKSSLLGCISGDLGLHRGEIIFGGRSLQDWDRRQLARQMAVLPQYSRLDFPFRVEQVVAMARIPHDTGAEKNRAIVAEVMVALDVSDYAQRLYTELSGGEKQRVQIARILAQVWNEGPALLLLDEPTAALDLSHQQQLCELLRTLAGREVAIVLVVHDFNLLSSLAGSISVLDRGRLYSQGSPTEILTAPMFSDVFAVQPSISTHPRSGLPTVLPQ